MICKECETVAHCTNHGCIPKQLIMIDPPSGWKYGFPKVYDPNTNVPVMEWLVHEGYPQQIIDSYGDYFFTRQWEAGADERG